MSDEKTEISIKLFLEFVAQYDKTVDERNALKRDLIAANADVDELEDIVNRILDLCDTADSLSSEAVCGAISGPEEVNPKLVELFSRHVRWESPPFVTTPAMSNLEQPDHMTGMNPSYPDRTDSQIQEPRQHVFLTGNIITSWCTECGVGSMSKEARYECVGHF